MVAGRRRSGFKKSNRKKIAASAILHLSSVLESSNLQSSKVYDSAARQILGISKKHGVRPSSEIKRKICRSCKISLTPGINSRVRVSSKKLIITCLECGRMERHGPNFGGPVNE